MHNKQYKCRISESIMVLLTKTLEKQSFNAGLLIFKLAASTIRALDDHQCYTIILD